MLAADSSGGGKGATPGRERPDPKTGAPGVSRPVASAPVPREKQEPCREGCEVPEAPFSVRVRLPSRRLVPRQNRGLARGWGEKVAGWQETCPRSK